MAEAGAEIAVSSITNDGADMLRSKQVRDEIAKAHPGRTAIATATDVTLGTGVQVMVRQVAKDLGGIDILVNAPDLFLGKAAAETTDIEFNRVMQVNLAGTFHACRAAGKEMLKQREADPTAAGRIINVASTLGERGLSNAAAYCAAQAGILNLTRALAQEWGPHGITVNAIAQGWMEYTPAIGDPNPEANQTVRFVPMKRAGRADELAPAALWLASPAAGYVPGQVVYVDGGLTTHL
jgi:NAD(P)-dependent dehydrogenase (short-subunit alcohol dehydrogenase family)